MTAGELVYRILAQAPFNTRSFDHSLLRQVLFTQIYDGNVASTRLSRHSLDQFIWCSVHANKIHWPSKILEHAQDLERVYDGREKHHRFGPTVFREKYCENDDVSCIQGLEFPHVYVARTGRETNVSSPLRTKIFSGECIEFDVDLEGRAVVVDPDEKRELEGLAKADRDREVYVALTRAEKQLTLLIIVALTSCLTRLMMPF